MRQNTAGQSVGAQIVSATDGSAFIGPVTVYITIDNGTQAIGTVGAGACTHEGNGWHSYAPSQAETNGDHVAFTFIGTGAVSAGVQVYTAPAAYPNDIADAILNRDMALVSDTNARTLLNGARFLRNKWAVIAGVLTVYEEDDVTVAWTADLTTTVGATAITGSDPT